MHKKFICSIIVAILLFPGLADCQSPVPVSSFNEEKAGRKELVILCIGDSITAGNYPARLQVNLNKAGIPAKVLNAGMGGYTSGHYLKFMKSFGLFRAVKPDLVLLKLGTNDVRTDFLRTETSRFVENMESIVRLIREELYQESPPLLLISTILPIIPQPFVFTESSAKRVIEDINPAIREIADRFGLILVDNFSLFERHPEWLIDGVHPDERGYQAMADNWLASITEALAKRAGSSGKTGFVYHEFYLQHNPGPGHPEEAGRLKSVVRHLEKRGLLCQLLPIEPLPASLKWMARVHTPQYIQYVQEAYQQGKRFIHSRDVPISSDSFEVARLAAGGVLQAIDAVMAGEVRNAFCLIRPPGHHAFRDRASGFCIFNNVAIGARYVQEKYHLQRVLIVDWDVHHGDGTQDIFYEDPTVLFFSVHQSPLFPGSGAREEIGKGKGEGYTINVPLPPGSGDKEFVAALREILKPRALDFNPDFVIISAGFDAHKDDPLGGTKVTPEGFAEMTRIVKEIAEKSSSGRLVSVLEGGYNLPGLAQSVEAHILALQE
ncbi:GDSL-type esterase/lipase family protein [candidate division NPL-UPA2 bacterium]|nr:GDSL-type esterase/lipase family protein [candidate division NPL-UPA2 bacterium]